MTRKLCFDKAVSQELQHAENTLLKTLTQTQKGCTSKYMRCTLF